MSQGKSGDKTKTQAKSTLESKGKLGATAKEQKIVNVVADKVLIDSKKSKSKTSIFSSLNQKLFGRIKLPSALEKYRPRPLNYHFNTMTNYGRANVSKATLGTLLLFILYVRHKKKASRQRSSTAHGEN
ncbi:uncharacterized protein LOC111048310 [Nilaparvata lugens]|uniref:uncharacterized protein LOC111048310 n=1 Tax=Nilaparvata lugens TaxID=108931 RepID=UPI000B984872|nr:uncharacterized protein LOC111048310 [Nilaparvata lugens]